MQNNASLFLEIGEPFAAGFMEFYDGPLSRTFCRAYRRYYETCPIVYRKGALLFPAGVTICPPMAVRPQFVHQYTVNWEQLEGKSAHAAELFREFTKKFHYAGEWNHSVLNYRRILAEGLDGYEARVKNMKDETLRESLLDVLIGIRAYHARALEHLKSVGAPTELTDALGTVPASPATTAYEALVCINFMLSLDEWDNVGRLDSYLAPYHKGEDLRKELRCLMQNVQDNDLWSLTLGPDCNDITRQILEVSSGMSRPMLQLRITKDTPDDIWALATKKLVNGDTHPSLYNEEAIRERLLRRIPRLTPEDALEFTGGGCTETCFAGLTYSGATDNDINVLRTFEGYMYESLPACQSFEEFYEGFFPVLHARQDAQMRDINAYYNERARTCFAPIRTLFVDDCIANEKGWLQGGARYVYSVCSDSGIPNTIDSLLAIRRLVYETKRYTPALFLERLRAEDPSFFAELKKCPAYGAGYPECDALAHDLTTRFYEYYLTGKLDIGIGYFPTAHQFRRHIYFGKCVGPTPDGRLGGTPVADSLAPLNGKAVKGPTVMLYAASQYEQKDIYGMAVTNLSISPNCKPETLRALIEGYFSMGGTQLQVTAQNRETLLAAQKDPDSYRNLLVRVGGYSDYFCRLNKEIQDAVIARTVFEA